MRFRFRTDTVTILFKMLNGFDIVHYIFRNY